MCAWNHHVLQGSNLEMVDRRVFDEVPDILDIIHPKNVHQELTCPPRIQPVDGGGCEKGGDNSGGVGGGS